MTGILILRTNTSRLVLIVAIPDSNIQLFCEHFNGTIPVKLYLPSWCRKWRFGEFHFKNCSPSRKSSFRERSALVALWNRTLKYYYADAAFEKALLVKEARGTRESEQKGSSFHAVPSRVPRASPIPLKGHGNECQTGRLALYVVLFLSLYFPFRFNCTPFSLSNMWYF